MSNRIEVGSKAGFVDAHGLEILANIHQVGIDAVKAVQAYRVFLIDSDMDGASLERVAAELLVDPVSEEYFIGRAEPDASLGKSTVVEVHLKPGVTDLVASSTMMAIEDMGLSAEMIRTAHKYVLVGDLTDDQKATIAQRVLGNDCIEEVIFGTDQEPPSPHVSPYQLKKMTMPLCDLDDDGLVELSKKSDLFLNLAEMKTIQDYYRTLKREPSDIELEMLAQTWSEHCVHKTFRGIIELTEYDTAGQVQDTTVVDNLLKSTIAKATFDLDKPWCISVFVDNAGVIEFDDEIAVCFKVETHNHPSAIEPYGGAATGIGGCIRDPMGTGLGAKPIANTDVFCFAEPDKTLDELPAGVLHPRRVMKGVVSGVRDYGNRMGIPTVNGAVHFDDRYLGNPLVFCGNIGIMPKDKCFGKVGDGNLIMVVGGRTGRDGIHGATFSSGEMTHEHETLFSHAVQIGNAIMEKKTLDTLLKARDAGLYDAITDCGAGGLSSAVGEMGEELGAIVNLEKVPLKYKGLTYTEVWISEAQERMVISVPPENLEKISAIFASENVEATVIGTFGNDGKLELRYEDEVVGQLDMGFLHDGIPKYTRKAEWKPVALTEPKIEEKTNYTDDLKAILSTFTVASKEWVVRQYDHEVLGGSAVKPLVGVDSDGPGDASVVRPKLDTDRGVAVGCGLCPQYSDIDPYWMAMAAIDEAVRNVVCVGGAPDRIAILDNFCWGNCDKPDRLGGLVRAGQGCYDAAMAYGTPFVSGKDSLNNEFKTDSGETINIPGTLLISAMTLVDDVNKCVTMDVKTAGNVIMIVGETKNELGASHYYKLKDELGANVPKVDLEAGPKNAAAVAKAIQAGLVKSAHDTSEGGLAVALAEMAFAGQLGIEVNLASVPVDGTVYKPEQTLFSESASRYVLEVAPGDVDAVTKLCDGLAVAAIGSVTGTDTLVIRNDESAALIDAPINELRQAWKNPLKW